MRLRGGVVLALAVVVLALPAGAAETEPHVTDECGDAGTHGEWNGDSMDFEETRPHLDIASGRVGGLYDDNGAFTGFTAAITVCGEVSAADGGYNIGWSYGGGCYGNVAWTLAGRHAPGDEGLSGEVQAAASAQAVVTEECYRPRTSPLDSGVDTIYRTVLPADAVVFDGATVTFTVAASALPEAAAPRLVAGTEWADISAIAMDQGPSMWAAYGDTEGNRGHLNVRTDFALRGSSYTVGEDAAA